MNARQRLFSIDEINALLPEIDALLARIHEQKNRYERRHDEFLMQELLSVAETCQEGMVSRELLEADARELDDLVEGVIREVERMRDLGCIIRSLERGWVDFPGKQDEKLVYYCWYRGEKTIQYYHSREGSCLSSERRLIPF